MTPVRLKKNRQKSVLNGHPWIFSGAIEAVDEGVRDGDIAAVCAADGAHLGYGYYNSKTAIAVRMLSFSEQPPDREYIQALVRAAVRRRAGNPMLARTSAYRLVFSEGDFLPGLIVDRYEGHLALQVLTLGMDKLKGCVIDELNDLLGPDSIYERSEHEGRRLEGLADSSGQVSGLTPESIIITEGDVSFSVDIRRGQKTGFFLDQRDNRNLVRMIAKDRKALNLFSYSGGFSLHALAGGALDATCVDASAGALEAAKANAALNGFAQKHTAHKADVFQYLRDADITADLIICDPPALVKSKPSLDKGARGYKDLNLQIARACPQGTLLLTCSCSRFVSMDLFQKIVFSAFSDAGRRASIIGKYSHPCDHPVSLYCPETEYLKALLVYVE
ncbi:MAG TPA: class I SAM-dependent rRNA methyltransferase [Spirochaetota bacterium]|nr:class I SAM-dependent rRNA methyltransferase [Spirochaetota bacterium]HPI90933.1 class I SAM-dependent rRNA methyltransferase [Spirochaetota bacterium]HPR47074.1 class I SAM-dependent rRNA methyltransferase [Spirochaetota bacterium]